MNKKKLINLKLLKNNKKMPKFQLYNEYIFEENYLIDVYWLHYHGKNYYFFLFKILNI